MHKCRGGKGEATDRVGPSAIKRAATYRVGETWFGTQRSGFKSSLPVTSSKAGPWILTEDLFG